MNAPNLPLKKGADDPLLSASNEDLTACAQLLASSVAHHRIKFGVVPITTTDAELGDVTAAGAGASLNREASSALQEAFNIVRQRRVEMQALDEADDSAEHEVPRDERRHQMRISATAPVQVSDLSGEQSRPATLRNISWGGAAICCDEMPATVGGRICLSLPQGRDQFIEIEATVLREAVVHGQREYGLRFDSLAPEDEARLMQVLKLLTAVPEHDMRRSEGRLVQRLEVEYGDRGEFQATLEDISTGGMLLTVPDPLGIDQSLAISLSSTDSPIGLNLRARVVHQTLVEDCDIDMYHVGLKFEHPSPGLRELTSAVINELAAIRLSDLPTEGDHDVAETTPDE